MSVWEILQQLNEYSDRVRQKWSLQHDVEANKSGELVRASIALLERVHAKDPFVTDVQKWRELMSQPYSKTLIRAIVLLIHELQRIESDHQYRS